MHARFDPPSDNALHRLVALTSFAEVTASILPRTAAWGPSEASSRSQLRRNGTQRGATRARAALELVLESSRLTLPTRIRTAIAGQYSLYSIVRQQLRLAVTRTKAVRPKPVISQPKDGTSTLVGTRFRNSFWPLPLTCSIAALLAPVYPVICHGTRPRNAPPIPLAPSHVPPRIFRNLLSADFAR